MKKLIKQLRASLLETPGTEIKEQASWYFPVISYSVVFKRVKKSKMDILMKMMLLTFEQTDIRRAANLAELLLVEELFIEDLLKKMERNGLVSLEKSGYKLTTKGHEQLKTGILDEAMDEESTFLIYSPFHDEFWSELEESFEDSSEAMPGFRYENNQDSIDKDRVLKVLTEIENVVEEDGYQVVVGEVLSVDEQQVEHVPCLEFQMYNKEKDILYARVWNTGLKRWDDTLEKLIEEKERLEWREKWLEVNNEE